jgi:hypothetical protein
MVEYTAHGVTVTNFWVMDMNTHDYLVHSNFDPSRSSSLYVARANPFLLFGVARKRQIKMKRRDGKKILPAPSYELAAHHSVASFSKIPTIGGQVFVL